LNLCLQPGIFFTNVLSSDEYHTECVMAAAENRKHVFVEKPVCLTMSDADNIIKAREEAGIQIMVGYSSAVRQAVPTPRPQRKAAAIVALPVQKETWN
jgi:hypothetical protein